MIVNMRLYEYARLLLFGLVLTILPANVAAGSSSNVNYRPITMAEKSFIEDLIKQAEDAFPPPDKLWNVKIKVSIDQNSFHRKTGKAEISDGFNNQALPVTLSIDMKFVTAEERGAELKTVQHTASMEDYQKQLMEAIQRGDGKAIQSISQEMNALQSDNLKNQMGNAINPVSKKDQEKPQKFDIRLEINSKFKKIGKFKDTLTVAGVTKSLNQDSKKKARRSYYIGPWNVREEFDRGRWEISAPEELDKKENHLRPVVLMVEISGDHPIVDQYIKNQMKMNKLLALVK